MKNKKTSNISLIGLVIQLIQSLVVFGILLWMFIMVEGFSKIVVVPFLMCGLAFLIYSVVVFTSSIIEIRNSKKYECNYDYDFDYDYGYYDKKIKYSKLSLLSSKIYVIGFLLFWFGFLAVWYYIAIRDRDLRYFFASFIFLIPGLWIVYKEFIKK